MALHTAEELADLAGELEATFDRTCQVQRATRTQSPTGAPVDVWAVVATVDCSKRPITDVTEAAATTAVRAGRPWVFRFARSVVLRGSDRIIESGVRHEVVDPSGDYTGKVQTRVRAVEVTT